MASLRYLKRSGSVKFLGIEKVLVMSPFNFFEVGGCVRDSLLGVKSKDVDFTVVSTHCPVLSVPSTFGLLEQHLESEGFEIFESRFQFLTIRARVPATHPLRARTDVADFVLARKDGPSSDGRRPDWVSVGQLHDDLARRDFRMNAIARDPLNGSLIDPFGGVSDIKNKLIQFVGDPMERVAEDGIRSLRAIRFIVTKGFTISPRSWDAIDSDFAAEMLHKVSAERIREELNKMLKADTLSTLSILGEVSDSFRSAVFRSRLRLDATFAK